MSPHRMKRRRSNTGFGFASGHLAKPVKISAAAAPMPPRPSSARRNPPFGEVPGGDALIMKGVLSSSESLGSRRRGAGRPRKQQQRLCLTCPLPLEDEDDPDSDDDIS
mmetsp:Transcript_14480/g.31774  ORF Transcript_14480/g.31774 Transcript_14480/m.31774 type:complete len:108 (-) Transcript_14480:19-342(-)